MVARSTSGALASMVLDVAEAGSPRELGRRMQRGLALSGAADAVGLYIVGDPSPRLCYSDGAPTGFLTEYAAEHARDDPLLGSLAPSRPVVEGRGVYGQRAWSSAPLRDLLRRWGYGSHLCGGVWQGRELRCVFYSAWAAPAPPSAVSVEILALLCRSASIAWRDDVRPLPPLPPRAAAVAAEVRRGLTNKEIAKRLSISGETVKEHVSALCRRTASRNRTELAARLSQEEP